jgi:hypothetical protein
MFSRFCTSTPSERRRPANDFQIDSRPSSGGATSSLARRSSTLQSGSSLPTRRPTDIVTVYSGPKPVARVLAQLSGHNTISHVQLTPIDCQVAKRIWMCELLDALDRDDKEHPLGQRAALKKQRRERGLAFDPPSKRPRQSTEPISITSDPPVEKFDTGFQFRGGSDEKEFDGSPRYQGPEESNASTRRRIAFKSPRGSDQLLRNLLRLSASHSPLHHPTRITYLRLPTHLVLRKVRISRSLLRRRL